MNTINKPALRAAVLIREQRASGPHDDLQIYLPDYAWNQIHRLQRQIDLAGRRGWHGAAARLAEDLAAALNDCRRDLDGAFRGLQSRPAERRIASASDVYRDILALYEEFEDVEIDLEEHTLSVTTDRIVLEYVGLGPFQIKLDWRQLGSSSPYRVVALEPNAAAKNDEVTHPHVQDEQLCEGEGRAAIRAALAECRLHDFFLLVSQTLHTYGRGNAYVELENWDGIPCAECGDSVDENSRYYCDRCGSTLCGNCSITCHGCDNGFCSGCVSPCGQCGQDFCGSCLELCSACQKQFCENCLEDGMCETCHEKQRNEEMQNDPTQTDAREQPAGRGRARRRRTPAAAPA